jgi:hypothetical protein
MMRLSRLACVSLLSLALAASAGERVAAAADSAEAAERFDQAMRLVDEGDLTGGLAQFERAYELIPSPTVSYNIGLVYAALHRPVEAARALEQALAHADELKPEYRDRAQRMLRAQQENIGRVAVTTNVKAGVVEIDNVEVAKLPLSGPLPVSGGPHIIGTVSPGYAPARREVIVAGRQEVAVQLELVAIEGLLGHIALSSRVPAADVLVDGDRVGKTPLHTTITVTPGAHTVAVRRRGYVTAEQKVTLGDGARADVTLDPVVDKSKLAAEFGRLELEVSEPQSLLTVDGEELGLITGLVELPAGPHRLHVESGGFLQAERDVEVPLGATLRKKIVFEPTPETRSRYVASAQSRRLWSLVTAGLGAAVAAGGFAYVHHEQPKLDVARANLDVVNANRMPGGPCAPRTQDFPPALEDACNATLNTALNDVDTHELRRNLGLVAAGIGSAAFITGLTLWITGDSPHRYDERPTETMFGEWRVVPFLDGRQVALGAAATF